MSSFEFSTNTDDNKVFVISKSTLTVRFDADFYSPVKRRFFNKLSLSNNIVKLGSLITDSSYGILPPGDSYDNSLPIMFLRATDLRPDLLLETSRSLRISEVYYRQKRARLRDGDILLAAKGATIASKKSVVYVEKAPENSMINGSIFRFQVAHDQSPKYVSYLLDSSICKRQMKYNLVANNAVDYLDKTLIYNLLLPLPSKDIQNQVVAKMDAAYEDKKAKEREAQALLGGIDDYLLSELGCKNNSAIDNDLCFTTEVSKLSGLRWDPLYQSGNIYRFIDDTDYEFQTIAQVIDFLKSGFAAGKQDQSKKSDEVIQIRPTNLNRDRELKFTKNVYIDRALLQSRKADILLKDEVLFNNTNSQILVGKTALFNQNGEYFCSNHMTRIKVNQEKLIPQYLTYVLNLYQRQQVFFKLCTNWNNQSGVNVTVLGQVKIPLPSLIQQQKIAEYITIINKKAKQLQKEAAVGLERVKAEVEAIILGDNQ